MEQSNMKSESSLFEGQINKDIQAKNSDHLRKSEDGSTAIKVEHTGKFHILVRFPDSMLWKCSLKF